jgi:hypothetical protein
MWAAIHLAVAALSRCHPRAWTRGRISPLAPELVERWVPSGQKPEGMTTERPPRNTGMDRAAGFSNHPTLG